MRAIAILSTIASGALAITIPIPVSGPLTTTTSKCNADNCARAVTGTAKGAGALSSRLAACSSYQSCTIRPGTSTVTVTTTRTLPTTAPLTTITLPLTPYPPTSLSPVTSPASPPSIITLDPESISTTLVLPITLLAARDDAVLEARQRTDQCPKAPPAFAASACGTDGARFRSACACAGITATTTTALAPVKTASTVTTTPSPGPDPGICYLSILLSKGQAACQCDYETSCGYTACSLSQRLTGSFNMNTCRDACDARADCRGFTLYENSSSPFCDLCLSDDSRSVSNGTYSHGVRDRNGDCVNSQCNLPRQ